MLRIKAGPLQRAFCTRNPLGCRDTILVERQYFVEAIGRRSVNAVDPSLRLHRPAPRKFICNLNSFSSLSFWGSDGNGQRTKGSTIALPEATKKQIQELETKILSAHSILNDSLRGESTRQIQDPLKRQKVQRIVDGIENLFNLYWAAHQSPNGGLTWKPSDSKVFSAALEAFSSFDARGSAALIVMDHWGEAFGSDIENRPERKHFDQLLRAYAEQPNSGEGNPAGEAKDVIELLEEWSFTYRPVAETYLYAIRCVSQGILYDCAASSQDNYAEIRERGSLLEELLQKVAPLLVAPYSDEKLAIVFQGLGEAIQALASLPEDSRDGEWKYSTTQSVVDRWLTLLKNDDLSTICNKEGLQFIDIVDACGNSILDLYTSYHENFDCPLASWVLVEQLEDLKLAQLPSNGHYYRLVKALNRYQQGNDLNPRQIVDVLKQTHVDRIPLLESKKATEEWNYLMKAYMEIGQHSVVVDLWKRMESEKNTYRSEESLMLYLEALCGVGTPETLHEAMDLVRKMMASSNHQRLVQPRHFEILMNGWAKTRKEESLVNCQKLLKAMRDASKTDPIFTPSETHFRALIRAWEVRAAQDAKMGAQAATGITSTIQEMESLGMMPSVDDYKSLLGVLPFLKSIQAAELAENILERLESTDFDSLTSKDYSNVSRTWLESGETGKIIEKCEELIRRNQGAFEKSGSKASLKPACEVYKSLIMAIGKTEAHDAGPRAEKILKSMEFGADNGLCEPPDEETYSSVIKAFSFSSLEDMDLAGETAARILARMESSFRAGRIQCKPNVFTYNQLLQIISLQSNPDNTVQIARKLYQQMSDKFKAGDLKMRPDTYTFSLLFRTLANAKGEGSPGTRKEIIEMVLSLLNDGEGQTDRRRRPMLDTKAFADMFRIIQDNAGSPTEGENLAGIIFEKCCKSGMMNSMVLNQVKRRFHGLYQTIPRDADGKLSIPAQWNREDHGPPVKQKQQRGRKAS